MQNLTAPLEKDIQRALCDYFALKGYFFYRNNNTPIFDSARDKYRAMPKYTMKGIADIVLIKNGRTYFLEVKRPGTYQSIDQKQFEADVTKAGAIYAVLRSIDDAVALGL